MSTRMKLYALVFATVFFTFWAGYGVGKGEAKPPHAGYGAASLEIAQEYWGTPAPPLCTSEEMRWEAPPFWATRQAAATAPTEPEPCVMWITPGISTFMLCETIVHEYGHWMGLGWGTDPNNIMYDGDIEGSDEYTIPWNPPRVPACWKLFVGKRP